MCYIALDLVSSLSVSMLAHFLIHRQKCYGLRAFFIEAFTRLRYEWKSRDDDGRFFSRFENRDKPNVDVRVVGFHTGFLLALFSYFATVTR